VVDYVMERLTAGTIFNLLPDDFDFFEHQRGSGLKLVKCTGDSIQRSWTLHSLPMDRPDRSPDPNRAGRPAQFDLF
jgi:hypothetical protein